MMGELLKTLHDFGIKMDDYKYLPLIDDYDTMKAQGDKTVYIVAILSKRYNLCERKIYKILKRMNEECRNRTVDK